jgi:hypothetical protein
MTNIIKKHDNNHSIFLVNLYPFVTFDCIYKYKTKKLLIKLKSKKMKKVTIKQTVIQEVNRVLNLKKDYYVIEDFNIDFWKKEEAGFFTYEGSIFDKYIKSLGYNYVNASQVWKIVDIIINGNKKVIVKKELIDKLTKFNFINK